MGPGPGGGQFTTAALNGTSNGLPMGAGKPNRSDALSPPAHLAPGGVQLAADDGVKDDASNSILNTWGKSETLQEHVEDHAADFGIDSNAPTATEEYVNQANQFLQKAQNGELPNATYPDGDIIVGEPETNTFGAYNPDGTTQTFYKPTSPTYLQRQFDNVMAKGGKINVPLSSNSVSGGGGGGGGGGGMSPGNILQDDPFLDREEKKPIN